MKRCAFLLCGVSVVSAANAVSYHPVITGFQSTERITHLAPGGANAARQVQISVQLFDDAGGVVRKSGELVELSARDSGPRGGALVGQLKGVTRADGTFTGTMSLGECRSPDIKGPTRVHRISNRPEYWDVTYVDALIKSSPDNMGMRFIHVCKEVYRGYRP
jgi:hypothetical protein